MLLSMAAPLVATETGAPAPMIGKDGPGFDACGAVGKVYRLSLLGEDMLPVHHDPSEDRRPKDKLAAGTLVWLCDASEGWQGIVYPTGKFQELGDCRVGSPVAEPKPYDGPCQSGWVMAEYVELVAG